MHMSQVLPTEFHAALAWLGKIDWLSIHETEEGYRADIRRDLINSTPGVRDHGPKLEALFRAVLKDPYNPAMALSGVATRASLLADGPKLFRPTAEQFDSMQHVDVHVPISEYQQPYPTMMIVVPAECRRALEARHNLPTGTAPEFVICRRGTTDVGNVMVSIYQRVCDIENGYLFADKDIFVDLEAAIMTWQDYEDVTDLRCPYKNDQGQASDQAASADTARAAINLMLMLVHYGCKDTGPLFPKDYANHRKNPLKAHLRYGDFSTVNMVQDVTIRREERRPASGDGTADHEVRPHWRRGHWRNQACGKGRKDHKRVFINPVLIRSDRAVGDLAASSVTYKNHGADQ